MAGGALTGVFAFYVFREQYEWTWTLAMAFGAIQSATDPVAVVSLLKELGAKPALAMTVGGESLLNDGAAAVAFTLFLEIITNPTETFDGEWGGLGASSRYTRRPKEKSKEVASGMLCMRIRWLVCMCIVFVFGC